MRENIKMKISKKTMGLILLIFIALLSIMVVSRVVTAPDFNSSMIESLNSKEVTVMKLATTVAAASTALSFIPGDAAMPIANQIAELAPYFILILGAILLEKMLIAVVGYVSFNFIIPFSCFLGICYLYTKKDIIRNLAIKLAIFGIIIFIAIPTSVKISDLIYDSYEVSIEQTFERAEKNKEYIEEKKEDLSKEDKNWIGKVGDYISNLTSKIGIGISEMVKRGEDTLISFLDAIAVMIITSCVIPIIVILIFVWVIKILFGFDINLESKIFKNNKKRKSSMEQEFTIFSNDNESKEI